MSHNDRQAFSSVRCGGLRLEASQCPRVRARFVGLGRCNIRHRLRCVWLAKLFQDGCFHEISLPVVYTQALSRFQVAH